MLHHKIWIILVQTAVIHDGSNTDLNVIVTSKICKVSKLSNLSNFA